MTDWKSSARKSIRDALRAGLGTTFACRFPSDRAVLVRMGSRYGIVTVQTSTTGNPDEMVFYINLGAGTDDWLAGRGFGPKTPKSDADCMTRDRLAPDPKTFPQSEFARFVVKVSDWNAPDRREALLSHFTAQSNERILPWIEKQLAG